MNGIDGYLPIRQNPRQKQEPPKRQRIRGYHPLQVPSPDVKLPLDRGERDIRARHEHVVEHLRARGDHQDQAAPPGLERADVWVAWCWCWWHIADLEFAGLWRGGRGSRRCRRERGLRNGSQARDCGFWSGNRWQRVVVAEAAVKLAARRAFGELCCC